MRSSLAKFTPDSIDTFKIKKTAWNEERILVVTPEQRKRLSKLENQLLDNIGKYLYE